MSQEAIFKQIGRRIRLGLIGDAPGSLIGPVHRTAARLDDCFEIPAGVFSSNPERSLSACSAGLPGRRRLHCRRSEMEGHDLDGRLFEWRISCGCCLFPL